MPKQQVLSSEERSDEDRFYALTCAHRRQLQGRRYELGRNPKTSFFGIGILP